jgi:NAD(P)-dependent dehydrogenase (short-subunit alcohol dehydrogenase family)
MGFFVLAACYHCNSDGAKKLIREAAHPSRIKVLKMDVTNGKEVKDAFETITSVLRSNSCQLYGLVNNAGIMTLGEIEFSSPQSVQDYDNVLQVNTMGVIRVTRTFLPLIRQSHGRIVNISSSMARLVTPGIGSYCVSKAACSKFTEVLQVEMSKFGVTVVGIEPWITKTNMITGKDLLLSLSQSWDTTPDNVKTAYGKKYFYQLLRFMAIFSAIPFDVQPEQVVDAVVEGLTSPEPSPVIPVMNTILSIPLWIMNELPPVEFVVMCRKWLFWFIFHLLSVEQLFTGRNRPTQNQ